MRIIHISSLPLLKGFFAINLFGVVFSRDRLDEKEMRHEYIHTLQQREMLFVGFFLWYFAEWIIKLLIYRNNNRAYRNISFEREAYDNEKDELYLTTRRHYAWWKYL